MDRRTAYRLKPDTDFLTDPSAQRLCKVFAEAGQHLYFVGGCVRNAILGEAASDIDMSTDAPPERVIDIVQAADLRAVPTGIDHGTVTVIVNGTGFEVTTFRRDVETDGRRAVVTFSSDIADDARRRDFTMNALYADASGTVHDPLGGLPDTLARRVRFIEDADRRIREDYLRILRFFRFSAQYALPDAAWDADALAAISANLDGLETLSAERVGAEMLKLLAAPDPTPAVSVMAQLGVLGRVLPGADPALLGPMVHIEEQAGIPRDALARLAVLGGTDVPDRLRLSRKARRYWSTVRDLSATTWNPAALGFLGGADAGRAALLMRAAALNEPPTQAALEDVARGAAAAFPVAAADFPDLEGAELGKRLNEIRHRWLSSGLTLDKAALLAS